MRILHVVRTVSPESGGVIEALLQLATAHNALGCAAEVASMDDVAADYLEHCNLPLHPLGKEGSSNYGKSDRLVPWLSRHHERYDAVVTHGLWQYHGLGTRIALQNTKTPYFTYPHGMLDPYFHKAYPLKYAKKFVYWKLHEAKNLQQAKALFFTCDEERKLARNSFKPYNITEEITGLGIRAPSAELDYEARNFRSKYDSILGNDPYMLFIGRLHDKKGIDLLIAAFDQVKKERPNEKTKLLIIGPCADENYLKALKAQAAPQADIHFIDMLTGGLKWGAYHAADAMILPSHQENFGIVVAESLACSTPVLISDKVNIWREVERDNAGYIAEDTQTGARQLIENWLDTGAEERSDMRIRARSCFNNRFQISGSAQRMTEAIKKHLT